MAISEDRLQILMPRRLKKALQDIARRKNVSVAEYIRRLVEAALQRDEDRAPSSPFPFGEHPIHTGRKRGSIDHDRPNN